MWLGERLLVGELLLEIILCGLSRVGGKGTLFLDFRRVVGNCFLVRKREWGYFEFVRVYMFWMIVG